MECHWWVLITAPFLAPSEATKFKSNLSSHGFRSVNAKQASLNRNGESCVRFNDVGFLEN